MKRTVLGTAVLLCVMTMVGATKDTNAAGADIMELKYAAVVEATDQLSLVSQAVITPVSQEVATKEPVTHVVKDGETLSSVARKHKTTWQRLFYKNRALENPDVVTAGQKLVIPQADEKLKSRKLPVKKTQISERRTVAPRVSLHTVRYATPASSAGNRYVPGNCTWYVKNRRPDLPNNLGDAGTWVARARAQGLPTGSVPKVGAVGQSPGHVVYVERVNGDGTILISDMNYKGLYIKTVRTVPAKNYLYIY
jgi:surface antigen